MRTLRQMATTENLHSVRACRHGESVTIPSEFRKTHKASGLLLPLEVHQPDVEVLVLFEVRVLQHCVDLLAPVRSHPQTFRSGPSVRPFFAVPPHSGASLALLNLSCDVTVEDIRREEHGVLHDHDPCILVFLTHFHDGRQYGRAPQSHHTLLRRKVCAKLCVELKRARGPQPVDVGKAFLLQLAHGPFDIWQA